MRQELAIRDKINVILNEGEEQLDESFVLGLIGALIAFSSLVLASLKAIEEGPGAPLHQMGHGGATTTQARQRPAFGHRRAEKRYHGDMVETLADAYANALDLARRYPQAAKFFTSMASKIRTIIILSRDYTGRELDQAVKELYATMYKVKQWAIDKDNQQGDLFAT